MINLSLPQWVTEILQKPLCISQYSDSEIASLKQKLSRFNSNTPLISVVIPAWNEEKGILHTIISLANSTATLYTELIVVDNNSTDGTAALMKQLGIKCHMETKQGVGYARTTGLNHARGKYILTCDSDTLYPPGWITAMTKAMIEGERVPVYCVHGSYSFLPGPARPRWHYGLYETISGVVIRNKENNRPFLNVPGFNCGFVRQKGIDVNGYDTEMQCISSGIAGQMGAPVTEDGMMAQRLQNAGGKIRVVAGDNGRVWTSDRRIQTDGGIRKEFAMRLKKHLLKS